MKSFEFYDEDLVTANADPETLGLIENARTRLYQWIDKSQAKIRDDVMRRLGEEAATIKGSVSDKIERHLAEDKAHVSELQAKIAAAVTGAGEDASDAARKSAEAVEEYLKQREDRWRKVGETIGDSVVSAGKKAFGIPL